MLEFHLRDPRVTYLGLLHPRAVKMWCRRGLQSWRSLYRCVKKGRGKGGINVEPFEGRGFAQSCRKWMKLDPEVLLLSYIMHSAAEHAVPEDIFHHAAL